jgi:hypothetical protein|tara:strand:- start:379 stop:600 length:222 start_codon:yes stop_codon:yes gene_type:complete
MHFKNSDLIKLDFDESSVHENFSAWKISNKGKVLQALTKRLSTVFGKKKMQYPSAINYVLQKLMVSNTILLYL